MIKRIISALLVLVIMSTSVAFADPMPMDEVIEKYLSDVIDSDRILKYDYKTGKELADGELLRYGDAVTVVTALGLMERDSDGNFNEDSAVTVADFAKLYIRLVMGDTDVFDKEYERYEPTEFVSQNMALHYLVMAIGHDALVYEPKGEWPYLQLGKKAGLLEKVSFNGGKNITRGELSQMILNAFRADMVEQTVFSEDGSRFAKIEGKNLIEERFDSVIVEGVVTAQNGLNIYSEEPMEKGVIEIDRVSYNLGSVSPDVLLGRKVIAVAEKKQYKDSEILGISVADDDESVFINFDDITELTSNEIRYLAGGDEHRAKISAVNNVVTNGTPHMGASLTASHITGDGELVLTKTSDNGSYDTAIVYNYVTACVSAVATFSEKLFIQGGATIGGDNHVLLNDDVHVYATLDGEKVNPYDIKAGNVVSIMRNAKKNSVYIKASTKSITGTVNESDSEYIYIEGNPYRLSAGNTYDNYPAPEVGQSGTFYLDYTGRVLRFIQGSDDEATYGYLISTNNVSSVLDAVYSLRIFTTNNKFEVIELADKVLFDGKSGISAKDVHTRIGVESDVMCYNPIRYKLNSNGKIIFLDTEYDDPDNEAGDEEAIRKAHTFSGGLNWTASSKHTSLDNTTYNWNATTPNFVIPTDRSLEEEYLYRDGPSYVYNQSVTIDLYCTNRYDTASLMVEQKTVRSASVFTDGYRYAMVTKLKKSLDDNGDEALAVEVLDGSNPPNFPRTTFVIHRDIRSKAESLQNGDIIQMNIASSVLKDFKMIAEAEWFHDSPQDLWIEPQGGRTEVLGTIESIDLATGMIKVSGRIPGDVAGTYKDVYAIYTRQSLGLYDKSTDQNYDITLGDLEPGDRVFCFGGVSYMRILAVRE